MHVHPCPPPPCRHCVSARLVAMAFDPSTPSSLGSLDSLGSPGTQSPPSTLGHRETVPAGGRAAPAMVPRRLTYAGAAMRTLEAEGDTDPLASSWGGDVADAGDVPWTAWWNEGEDRANDHVGNHGDNHADNRSTGPESDGAVGENESKAALPESDSKEAPGGDDVVVWTVEGSDALPTTTPSAPGHPEPNTVIVAPPATTLRTPSPLSSATPASPVVPASPIAPPAAPASPAAPAAPVSPAPALPTSPTLVRQRRRALWSPPVTTRQPALYSSPDAVQRRRRWDAARLQSRRAIRAAIPPFSPEAGEGVSLSHPARMPILTRQNTVAATPTFPAYQPSVLQSPNTRGTSSIMTAPEGSASILWSDVHEPSAEEDAAFHEERR